jgi:tetratricopeptide (TPR) repeat protein
LHEKILPHYRSIVSFQEARDGCNIEVVRASTGVTDYLSARGRVNEAIQTIEVIMPVQQKWLGRMDVDYLATLDILASVHMRHFNYDQAESLVEQVSQARVATLGATHLDTLDSTQKLAGIYKEQQRYEEASSLQELVLSRTTKRLGADHEVTLVSQYDLGQIYEEQGNFVKAELMYEDTLRSIEKTLGTSDFTTLRVLRGLGVLKHKLQRFDEADVLLTRALAVDVISEISLAKFTAKTSLGVLRRDQGRFAEAGVLLKASLADIEKLYGTEHYLTAVALRRLAWVYVDMRRFADAEPLLRRAVNIIDSSGELGGFKLSSHYLVVTLASVIEQQNRVAEAEGVYRKVWDEVSQEPDSYPLTTIICAASLSRTLYAQERTQEAEPLHERALNSLERALTWLYRRGIYDTNDGWREFVTIGRVLEDEAMCKIALKVQEERIGIAHPVTKRTRQALVAILHGKGKAEEEEALVQRCEEAGLELRLPEDAEAPGLGGGDSGAESAG